MNAPENRLALSALQHLLYCPRQCALIHVERLWSENWHTASGRLMHDRTDTPEDVVEYGIRVTRAMTVWSDRLGLYGICDVVEWRDNIPTPVEYKRGKPKAHRADEVQLCAQAMCLEEMFNVQISQADLFYGKTRRRATVELDCELRKLTSDLAEQLHRLVESGATPPAEYDRKRCSACSLLDVCVPRKQKRRSVDAYMNSMLDDKDADL